MKTQNPNFLIVLKDYHQMSIRILGKNPLLTKFKVRNILGSKKWHELCHKINSSCDLNSIL